jgi:hypothetical protein
MATTGTKWLNPVYDAAGNMRQGPRPGNEQNASGGQGQKVEFDAWNRLVEVQQCTYTGADSPGNYAPIEEYEYDGLPARKEKLVSR